MVETMMGKFDHQPDMGTTRVRAWTAGRQTIERCLRWSSDSLSATQGLVATSPIGPCVWPVGCHGCSSRISERHSESWVLYHVIRCYTMLYHVIPVTMGWFRHRHPIVVSWYPFFSFCGSGSKAYGIKRWNTVRNVPKKHVICHTPVIHPRKS